jgi:hypothetical protein
MIVRITENVRISGVLVEISTHDLPDMKKEC